VFRSRGCTAAHYVLSAYRIVFKLIEAVYTARKVLRRCAACPRPIREMADPPNASLALSVSINQVSYLVDIRALEHYSGPD
jgi:hypothetical protein